LAAQSEQLKQALTEMQASKNSLTQSTALLEQSLKANADLKSYNTQIAERMQQRDEDLAGAYDTIDRVTAMRNRLIVAVIIMGLIIAGGVALALAKFLYKR
jgi:small-conductance mechanosensitive channel